QAERIKDVAGFAGVRSNQLIGFGLVVGLDSTGDQTSQAPFTVQALKNMLVQLGINIPPGVDPQLRNVAAVSVHAELPAFAKPGQRIDVTVSSIGNARSLRGGSLLVTPLKGLDGNLYVAEVDRILRFDNIEENLSNPPEPIVINDTFPKDRHHGWKFIRFGPDGKLYVPVGAPCNICEREKEIYATITRIDPDGLNLEIFSKGIRNTVGFDWHPETQELWFTENGRDLWGDDRPPEELNHAPRAGLHFGFPYRYGKALIDTTFKTDMKPADFEPAAFELPAHTAALGMRFYTGKSFPKEYHKQIFIAEHGSWNRSNPDGYCISVIKLKENRAVSYERFATGWLVEDNYWGGKYWGRPVDVEVLPDGSLLVSDDFAYCIYRISFSE
ncbi:flagellar basal body P-ring protein FlgI, partial [candidate division KSB1 bacterium]|nr:flagellar basal body P-ring protein FlgI [candidate division KSB1 bacterium]